MWPFKRKNKNKEFEEALKVKDGSTESTNTDDLDSAPTLQDAFDTFRKNQLQDKSARVEIVNNAINKLWAHETEFKDVYTTLYKLSALKEDEDLTSKKQKTIAEFEGLLEHSGINHLRPLYSWNDNKLAQLMYEYENEADSVYLEFFFEDGEFDITYDEDDYKKDDVLADVFNEAINYLIEEALPRVKETIKKFFKENMQ